MNSGVKFEYLKNTPIGTLVAFNILDSMKSGKIINRSINDRKLKVETKYNEEYIIDFEDVTWVKTGSRWPKGIYKLLKGVKENEATTT